MINEELKADLFNKCLAWVEAKIKVAEEAVKNAQAAANNEEKSSAGDKYETGRAMSQNERDMNARQLTECLKQKQLLLSINFQSKQKAISSLGSVILTSKTNYYIAISAGKIVSNEIDYFAISPETPIAKLILNKKKGDVFMFNGSEVVILEIF